VPLLTDAIFRYNGHSRFKHTCILFSINLELFSVRYV
jgi:hypothetical protein